MEKNLRARVHERIKEQLDKKGNQEPSAINSAPRTAPDIEEDDPERPDYDEVERAIERKLDRLGIRQPTVKRLDLKSLQLGRDIEPWAEDEAEEVKENKPVAWAADVADEDSKRDFNLDSLVNGEVNKELDGGMWGAAQDVIAPAQRDDASVSLAPLPDTNDATENDQLVAKPRVGGRKRFTPRDRRSKTTGNEELLRKFAVKPKAKTEKQQAEEKDKLKESILKLLGRL
jgi:hypothetical protein